MPTHKQTEKMVAAVPTDSDNTLTEASDHINQKTNV